MSRWGIRLPPLVVLGPIEPLPTGNGLAMRSARFIEAAALDFQVLTVVVPVAGRPPGTGQTATATNRDPRFFLGAGEPGSDRAGLVALLRDRGWRDLLGRSSPLPVLARAASPGLAASVSRLLTESYPLVMGSPVHVIRSYLAPLGLALSEALGSPWRTLDLDDDDESFALASEDGAEAEAYHRLLSTFATLFSRVAIASPDEAAAVRARHPIDPLVLPNAVEIPRSLDHRRRQPPRLLFVGNLDYGPNVRAAVSLASTILPATRERSGMDVTLSIVGSHAPRGAVAQLAGLPGVKLLGYVDNLDLLYAESSVVVAPLPFGSGTKIKILEAFAHRVPVVTTPVGAAGLAVTHRTHLMVAEDDDAIVGAVLALLGDPVLASALKQRAFDYVRRFHSPTLVSGMVRQFLGEAAQASGPGATR